jgi:hypothetical protein
MPHQKRISLLAKYQGRIVRANYGGRKAKANWMRSFNFYLAVRYGYRRPQPQGTAAWWKWLDG